MINEGAGQDKGGALRKKEKMYGRYVTYSADAEISSRATAGFLKEQNCPGKRTFFSRGVSESKA
jgi:hypothetical protein